MRNGVLEFTVVDPDPDYLGVEIRAQSDRFAATTFIFAGHGQLTELADLIAGTPASVPDQRRYELGSPDPHWAGGYCTLLLKTSDRAGHLVLEVHLADDDQRSSGGQATFNFPVEAAAIDAFVQGLRAMDAARSGYATLGPAA